MAKIKLKKLSLILKKFAAVINHKFATKGELSALEDSLGNSVIVDVPIEIDETDDEMLVIDATAEAYIDDEILVFGEEDEETT